MTVFLVGQPLEAETASWSMQLPIAVGDVWMGRVLRSAWNRSEAVWTAGDVARRLAKRVGCRPSGSAHLGTAAALPPHHFSRVATNCR